ncbi:NAD(P)-dependent oxidoreductase [Rhodobacteraceae bacterium WD3A24]|nr:NAD(P)-dependent oxidoreductase [Rhodobacteraceae bacterium WD3A24]
MTVGIVGLGIMGSAYAANLVDAGVAVAGADPSDEARQRLVSAGGTAHESAGPWLAQCDLVILALASPKILGEVSQALGDLLEPGQVVVETGTFALADKLAAQAAVERSGAVLLDSPVSGTGAQAASADLVFMASGPADAIETARPYLRHICHTVIEAGPFGAGSKLKYVANHAVALHNCAAAETLHYADALDLDREVVYRMLSNGAGQSRMSDLRMPLMIEGRYEPATAQMSMFEKDLSIIGDDIRAHDVYTPMFEVVDRVYSKAWENIPKDWDTAAVFEVYRRKDRRE